MLSPLSRSPCSSGGTQSPQAGLRAPGSAAPAVPTAPPACGARAGVGAGAGGLRRATGEGLIPSPQRWSGPEKLLALDELIDRCEPSQIKYMMQVIEPQFQRDFISLLPKEVRRGQGEDGLAPALGTLPATGARA